MSTLAELEPSQQDAGNGVARLGQRLAALAACGSAPVDYDGLLEHAMTMLVSPGFARETRQRQVEAVVMIAFWMIVPGHAQAGLVAGIAAGHVRRLLRDPTLTLPEACALHEALWGMWWGAAASLDDMRPVHSHLCLPFHDFLEARGLVAPRANPPPSGADAPLRIAYLMHYAHGQRGNAVAPLIVSLARAHAALPGRTVFVYAVQWAEQAWLEASFAGSGVIVRSLPQQNIYGGLPELFDNLRADEVEAIVSEITSSIAAYLFARRTAPVQLWIDMGLPYWFQPEIDLVLEAGKRRRDGYPFTAAQSMEIHLFQDRATLFREPPDAELTEARSRVPAGGPVLAVFARLIKITPEYLAFARALLLRHASARFLLVGGGDPRLIAEFAQLPELAGRVIFVHGMVDLAAYARVIDVFVDTFPFIGGLTCREIAAQGVPVASSRSHEWDRLQDRDRDPASIVDGTEALGELIDRLLTVPEFHRARAEAARAAALAGTDVAPSATEIEAAVGVARARRGLSG